MTGHAGGAGQLVARSGKILRREDAACYVQARDLLKDAEVQAKAMIEAAKAEIAEKCRAGYEEARSEGRQEQLAMLSKMAAQRDAYLAGAEQELCTLLLAAVRTIFADFSDAEKTRIVVTKALSALRSQTQASIRVHPDHYDSIREHLAQAVAQSAHWQAFEVKADGTVGESACIVSSEMGTIETSIDLQIAALQAAIAQALAPARAGGADGMVAEDAADAEEDWLDADRS